MEEAAAVESGGMRQPAGGKAAAAENWISSDSMIATQHWPTTCDKAANAPIFPRQV